MPQTDVPPNAAEPFNQFWNDYFSRIGMSAPGMAGGAASNDAARQMQRVFFDTMAKYCEDFMRSDQFLSMMKQTMDRSLAFKQQMDQFLGKMQQGMQSPAATDLTDMAGTLRNIEQRLLARIDELERKIAAVEDRPLTHKAKGRGRAGRVASASRAKRPPGRSERKGQRRR